ncbi:MAG: hypothetical protein HYR55_19155 [Acidobacteria bacterium]|nr:hypothetical protein [Acidobacteriota bacterium]MBI3658756.1 hypothetical protein [Acidobacteriota bacterium]
MRQFRAYRLMLWLLIGLFVMVIRTNSASVEFESLDLVTERPAAFAQEKTPPASTAAGLLNQIDQLKATVETIRGLKFKSDIKRGLQSAQEFRTFLMKDIEREYTEKKLYAWKKWLVKFGFMEDQVDIKKLMYDLLQEQVIGYYDPERKKLYLIDRDLSDALGGAAQSKEEAAAMELLKSRGFELTAMLVAHELDHALTDQHFDLTKLRRQREANEDRSKAVTALIEGESTLAMIEYIFKGLGVDASVFPQFGDLMEGLSAAALPSLPKLDQAPAYFRENLMFSYMQGAKLAWALRKAGGWDLLNQAMRNPPESTEQILHPEKYWPTREQPIMVTVANAQTVLGHDWVLLEENSLGEFNLSILGRKYLPVARARTFAVGWGGDSFQIFEHKKTKETALVWYTTWDSVEDAKKFFSGYYEILTKKYTGAVSAPERILSGDTAALNPKAFDERLSLKIPNRNRQVVLERIGPDVVVVEGFAASLIDPLVRRVWQSRKQALATPLSSAK